MINRGMASDRATIRQLLRGVMRLILLALLVSSTPLLAQSPGTVPGLNFTAQTDAYRSAADEYRDIWAKEGRRIVASMERTTGLRFDPGPIEVSVYEGPSYSGERGGRPMLLRASYPAET
jgi:hypothetical protein